MCVAGIRARPDCSRQIGVPPHSDVGDGGEPQPDPRELQQLSEHAPERNRTTLIGDEKQKAR